MTKKLLFLIIILPISVIAQEIKGVIYDNTKETVIGARIESSEGEQTRSDIDGNFNIKVNKFPVKLTISAFDYKTQELTFDRFPEEIIEVSLESETQEIEGVVVSASRRQQKIENIPVSLEIIKPELIENKALTNVEEAVNQAPGAYAMDGQISIRGGSGFSYGAGSRVMVVWNDIPLLAGDAGDAKWQSIPIENISQIEVLKGASSVLYGSGALNGIVSLRDKEPSTKPETSLSYQFGIYDNPKRESLRLDNRPLVANQINAYHGRMLENWGFTLSAYGFQTDGYRSGEKQLRGRLNGAFYLRPKKTPNLKAGLNYSVNREERGIFIVWESDSLAYYPQGGVDDPYSDSSSLTLNTGTRIIVDPYVKWFDSFGNKHYFQSRWYFTANDVVNGNQSATASLFYSDYKFERKFKNELIITSGITATGNIVNSDLYGDHNSENYAIYTQLEKQFGKFDITGGVRAEYFQQNNLTPDSYTYWRGDSSAMGVPFRPIFRLGTHYELKEYTHLRASLGQAFRYPSVAERYASTSVGALNIFPNPNLQPESGWSAEIGIKQGVKIKNWKGYFDASAFINEYDNMMEFTFGFYYPNPGFPPLSEFEKWFGFRAENAEAARITGLDFSLSGVGNIGPVEVVTIMGYTYMNPISLNEDSTYRYGTEEFGGGFSDTSSNMLKYRFNHLAKGDIQFGYKKWMLGFSGRYNSFMRNIDAIFEDGVTIGAGTPLEQTAEILPGLKEYRAQNNNGDVVFDARLGYKFTDNIMAHIIVNNIMNREFMTRPGDIQAPRQFLLRLQAKF